MPEFESLLTFMRDRCQVLEATTSNNSSINLNNQALNRPYRQRVLSNFNKPDFCNYCRDCHKIYSCEEFVKLSVQERENFVRTEKLCFNCLRKGHSSNECNGLACRKCKRRHNILLHLEAEPQTESILNPIESTAQVILNSLSLQDASNTQILLSTAVINIKDTNGVKREARVLLDSGSMNNFMTEEFARSLGLSLKNVNIPVEGFNLIETRIKHKIDTLIYSKHSEYSEHLEFLVAPRICDVIPMQYVNRQFLNIPQNIKLADPEFHKPAQIDALIGAEFYGDLFCVGQIELNEFKAKLQKTKLGWIVSGKLDAHKRQTKSFCNVSLTSLKTQMEMFWKIEEMPEKKYVSNEDAFVEKFYQDTVKRDLAGRYIVKLPFNKNKSNLGQSFELVKKRFLALERKLHNNPELKREYTNCINDFIDLGHMVEIPSGSMMVKNYLPHHAVMKNSSVTTKLRVVFDGSAKSTSGVSLNDILYVGPNIQEELYSILVRFRTHPIVLIADIEKHYRMIMVDDEDCLYQVILWRNNPDEPLREYMIKVVMFGSKPSTFLSVRTLHQLAKDEFESFPVASQIVKRDFYIDDLITGAKSVPEAIKLRNEIQELLCRGGFNLRKWSSSNVNVLETLPQSTENIKLFSNDAMTIKALGMEWDSRNDFILYSSPNESNLKVSKRTILSQISQLFDPIGLLGPIIVKAKMIMKELWKIERLHRDESVPIHIHTAWISYKKSLNHLSNIKFERKIIVNEPNNIQIHGFCDASEKAYGACIYLRSQNLNNEVKTNLVCSKSRIAPLKFETLAKLELCSALLLANLLKKTLDSLNHLKIDGIYLWSDAEITLQWINTEPYLLKTFYANRVSQILTITNASNWRHIPGENNPADYISRGQTPLELQNNKVSKSKVQVG